MEILKFDIQGNGCYLLKVFGEYLYQIYWEFFFLIYEAVITHNGFKCICYSGYLMYSSIVDQSLSGEITSQILINSSCRRHVFCHLNLHYQSI